MIVAQPRATEHFADTILYSYVAVPRIGRSIAQQVSSAVCIAFGVERLDDIRISKCMEEAKVVAQLMDRGIRGPPRYPGAADLDPRDRGWVWPNTASTANTLRGIELGRIVVEKRKGDVARPSCIGDLVVCCERNNVRDGEAEVGRCKVGVHIFDFFVDVVIVEDRTAARILDHDKYLNRTEIISIPGGVLISSILAGFRQFELFFFLLDGVFQLWR
jgi:hypothetical protein